MSPQTVRLANGLQFQGQYHQFAQEYYRVSCYKFPPESAVLSTPQDNSRETVSAGLQVSV